MEEAGLASGLLALFFPDLLDQGPGWEAVTAWLRELLLGWLMFLPAALTLFLGPIGIDRVKVRGKWVRSKNKYSFCDLTVSLEHRPIHLMPQHGRSYSDSHLADENTEAQGA